MVPSGLLHAPDQRRSWICSAAITNSFRSKHKSIVCEFRPVALYIMRSDVLPLSTHYTLVSQLCAHFIVHSVQCKMDVVETRRQEFILFVYKPTELHVLRCFCYLIPCRRFSPLARVYRTLKVIFTMGQPLPLRLLSESNSQRVLSTIYCSRADR